MLTPNGVGMTYLRDGLLRPQYALRIVHAFFVPKNEESKHTGKAETLDSRQQ